MRDAEQRERAAQGWEMDTQRWLNDLMLGLLEVGWAMTEEDVIERMMIENKE